MYVAAAPPSAPSPPPQPGTPLSPHEHALFVEAVEQHCNAAEAATGEACWARIAAHVRTRTADEVKAHAQYYLMSLQSRNPEITAAATAGASAPAWSPAENAAFEAALAQIPEDDPDRWDKIAAGLPAKSPADVRQWYERLLGDLLEIERGAHTA
mmetsp:Transcript_13578/g.40455  ORF Transcript_13578/g.40455 Transcript_13578/m.40455 type:complete len:155 (-) Transcript_13578:36-500(-)